MSGTIEIRDVGPVEHLTIPVPAEGGIVVLTGDCGVGKSHSLDAVSALVGGKARVPSRDGSLGAHVEGLGARLTIGRRANHAGEIEVSHLEGEDPSLLVDPGIKSPDAADAARIKALLRLARAQVDVDKFAELVDGRERLEALCRPGSLDARGDVPSMAAAIKRDLEAAARKKEGESENAFAKADGVRATLKGFEGEDAAPELRYASAQEVREAHTRAIREHQALETRRTQCASALAAAREARDSLKAYGDTGTPESVEDARQEHERRLAIVEGLRQQLRAAEADAVSSERTLVEERAAAERRAPLERSIEAAKDVREIPAEAVEVLARAVESAEAEVGAWQLRERTKRLHDDVSELEAAGKRASEEGAALREAARGTEGVVLDAVRAVCGEDMGLHEGRLYVQTDRGKELFSDLSTGERWRRALDIGVAAVGNRGLFVVNQEAYQSLSPKHRKEIAEYARERSVVIITAEVADGDIRAEVQAS